MNKFARAASLAATLLLMAPLAAGAAPVSDRMQLAQADVTVKKVTRSDGMRKKVVIKHRGDSVRRKVVIRHGDRGMHRGDSVRRKVVIRHGDRGMHRGWRHSRHYGATRSKTVIKHRNGTTTIKKIDG